MTSVTSVSFSGPFNKWDKNSIRPGPVGSVGDTLTSVRIKQSYPDADFAWNKKFNPKTSMLRGSNVQDGRWASFSDGGYNAQLKKKNWNKNGSFRTATGFEFQNIIPEARVMQPKLLDQPGQGWKNQAAEIMQRQGDKFQTFPGGYGPTEPTRGGQFPRRMNNSITGNLNALPMTASLVDSIVFKPSQIQETIKIKTE